MSKKLITQGALPHATKHLTKPCTDCPLRRDSLRGWLGGSTAEDYARLCHSDAVVKCHVHEGSRCAGLAIYRSNTCKSQPKAHALPSDHDIVFSNIMQFTAHHQTVSLETVIPVSEQNQEPDDATLEEIGNFVSRARFEPDLSKAPEGATHYIRVQSYLIFFKVEGDAIFCFTKSGGWKRSIVTAAEALRDPDYVAIPRPTSTGNPVDVTYEQIAKTHEDMLKQQADSMVSYDIDSLSIEQLRHGHRYMLLSSRELHLLDIKERAAIATRLLDAESTVNTLLDALLHALPYVEDVLSNPAELACFKKGVVQKHATQIRAAIALAEKHEDSQPPQVTKSEFLDSLKSLIKMHGHRDPISDKLLPSDLQPELEVAAAMRLVFRAGGAV